MSIPLLATKLYVPPLQPNFIPRSRLLEKLGEEPRKLTLISAPAGFGKTTLVTAWLARQPQKTAWLSLEEDDHDLNRFLTYFLSALQQVNPKIGQGLLNALYSPQPPPINSILIALINEVAALPEDLLVVLDDYHLVDSVEVDSALTLLIDHLPPQLHLIIITREDPNLSLAKLRVRNQLTEIRADDLRFTIEEATEFLNQMMGLSLTAEEVAALEGRTEGWIAGLQLAAISMQGHHAHLTDRANFIRTFTGSNRFVMDYLVEEVLEQQPSHIQDFLLQTSVLNRLCGPLCDAVRERTPTDGQTILEQLEQANLFLIALDRERRWYRYHHLFAELLRQRLQQQVATSKRGGNPAEDSRLLIPEIHRRASLWFEENHLLYDAVRHALAAKDFDRTAALLELTWRDMDDNRQSAQWRGWAQKLPDEMIRARPVLCAAYGWSLLENGELELADSFLQAAEKWLGLGSASATLVEPPAAEPPASELLVSNDVEFQSLPATIAAARTYHALAVGDVAGTKRYARQALDLLPVDQHLRRGVPGALLGLALWADGDLERACRTFADSMDSFRIAGNILFAVTGSYILADMKRVQGRLHEAVQIHQRWLQRIVDQNELVQRGAADIYTGLSELACEQGDLETATAHLQKSEEMAGSSPPPRWRYRWSLAKAHLAQTQGDLISAHQWIDEAEKAFVRGPVPDVRPIPATRARLWIVQDRVSEAKAWAQKAELGANDTLSYLREYEHITLARLRIAQYRVTQEPQPISDALALLARLLRSAEDGGRMGNVIEILMLHALAYEAQNELSSAVPLLERALSLAEPEGYLHLFVNEGKPMAHLLAHIAAFGSASSYISSILSHFHSSVVSATPQPRAADPHPATPQIEEPQSALVDPLTKREVEVLALVAQGLSNREICEKLFLSINTVKGHNRRIFEKLQVNRRTEAVARARNLGIV